MGVISGKDYRPDISTRQPSWAKTNNNGECYGGNRPFMGNNGDQGQEHGGPDTYHSCVVDRKEARIVAVIKLLGLCTTPTDIASAANGLRSWRSSSLPFLCPNP